MHKLKSRYISLNTEQRLYCCELPIIGLTGGIATGKSTASNYLKSLSIPLIDADKLIHRIYQDEATVEYVAKLVPEAIQGSQIDFKKLRERFFQDKNIKSSLEDFLYQRMPVAFQDEIKAFQGSEFRYLVYDVPLLFEKGLQTKIDISLLIYASQKTQKIRLKNRDNQTPEQIENILKNQIDIEEKRQMAKFVVENESNIKDLESSLSEFLDKITI